MNFSENAMRGAEIWHIWKQHHLIECFWKILKTGREVAVDEVLQLEMANRILDVSPPQTIVLLTGDGSGYTDGKGFIKQLERAVKHGWAIEVVSWDKNCNRYLRAFTQQNGTYRPLEPAYERVTFVNNKRWAQPV